MVDRRSLAISVFAVVVAMSCVTTWGQPPATPAPAAPAGGGQGRGGAGRGGPGGGFGRGAVAFTPTPGAKDLKSVLYNWTWHMGMLRSGAESELVKTLRARIDGLVLRTTFIVGHPGETAEEFDELCEFVAESRFDRAGAFTYSVEPGTTSALLPHRVDPEVSAARQQTLMEIQRGISRSTGP